MHSRAFHDWLAMNLDDQSRELAAYLSTPEGRAAFLSFNRRELAALLAPRDIKDEERNLFHSDMATVLMVLSQHQSHEEPAPIRTLTERIA